MIEEINNKSYDTLVIGGGIAGLESALNLAEMGHNVLIVEKDLSIGGKMIHLSKVFPTLDCSACITTPKVSEVARHPKITILTYAEIETINRINNKFTIDINKKPRYVNEDTCTGCQDCELKCPVVVNDQYQYDLVGRKAIYVPFSIANPRVATIDIENCTFCGYCEKVCPADAIDFTQTNQKISITARSVIIATGFNLFDPLKIPRYGYGEFPNVLTSMHMERQLVPTRPFNTVLRPSDGKVPDNIAYVLCTGSRDATVGNTICSQICCMYSIKQAQLLMGALPMADITLYYLHIRAFGKGFQEFYKQAIGMGVEFINGKVGKITQKENGDLILRYEDMEKGVVKEAEHDLVVLSVGVMPNNEILKSFNGDGLKLDEYNYINQVNELTSPSQTSIEGVFVAGTASGPMDIPDSILSAGTAATEVVSYLNNME